MYLSLQNRAIVNALIAEGKTEEAAELVKEWKAAEVDKNEKPNPGLKRNDELMAKNAKK
jgi:hypothetical protein